MSDGDYKLDKYSICKNDETLEKILDLEKEKENKGKIKIFENTANLIFKGICDFFEILNEEDIKKFKRYFEQVAFGKGHEIDKMYICHSSSLLCLLNFFKVSENTPFYFDGHEYTKVYFEWKNKCINNEAPSCLDACLFSKDNKYMLCIESKLSEYITKSNKDFNEKYAVEFFQEEKIGEYFEKLDKYPTKLKSKKSGYNDGIKQVLCHLYGIKNIFNRKDEEKERVKYIEHIRFIELCYESNAYKEYLKKYKELYSEIFKKDNLKDDAFIINDRKIKIEFDNRIRTYQELFKENSNNIKLLLPKVKSFYYD